MSNEKFLVTASVTAIVLVAAIIAGSYLLSWKMVVDGGYEQRMVPGSAWPIWVRTPEERSDDHAE